MRLSWCAILLLVGMTQTTNGQSPVVLARSIDLPAVEGRIDHLALATARHQLFVAALGNNTVEVLDLDKGVRTQSLAGFPEPQGIVALPDLNLVAVANGRAGDLRLVDMATRQIRQTIPLSEDADNVRYDAVTNRIYVAHGSGAVSAVDAVSGRVLAEVRLNGHPESFQLERAGSRIFVNVPDAKQVAVQLLDG